MGNNKRLYAMNNNNINEVLRAKILKGLDLTFAKLVKAKQQTGGTLYFQEKGK